MTESPFTTSLCFAGRPVERGEELIAYATRRGVPIEAAAIELINQALASADQLAPIRDAMAAYEAKLVAREHGGVAAAAFVDQVYAILNPYPAQPPEPIITTVGDEQPAGWGDGEGWIAGDEKDKGDASEED